MVNNTNDSKLDQAVKQTLSNYEAPYDAADWTKMESMLNAAPASTNFNWSYTVKIFIGLVILGGGYLIYHSLNSSKSTEEISKPAPVETIENKVTEPAPLTPPVSKELPPAKTIETPVIKNDPSPLNNQNNTKAIPATVEAPKNNTVKEENNTARKEEDMKSNKKKPVLIHGMGNEPIFGDMLDSSKGIIGNTKEKEATKKAAQKQPSGIGWSNFILHNNLDSLKKFHDQQQKDSLKK